MKNGVLGRVSPVLRSSIGMFNSFLPRGSPCSEMLRVEGTPRGCGVSAEGVDIARQLEGDPQLTLHVLHELSPERRRYLLVAATANEWYGARAVPAHLDSADADKDKTISSTDFHLWVKAAWQRRRTPGLSVQTLLRVALCAACPFVAFGFLDNSVMLLSGDVIDHMLGQRFHLSVMAAAAIGGVVSGTMGIQIHGFAERFVDRVLGIRTPPLTAAQSRSALVFRASHIGGTSGILIGLILGMWPLLVMKSNK